jgi:hypothetical protein
MYSNGYNITFHCDRCNTEYNDPPLDKFELGTLVCPICGNDTFHEVHREVRGAPPYFMWGSSLPT